MLFRINIDNKEGYIYFLFEHKSYTTKNISFQLLKYMIEIWEAKIKDEYVDELPMVIPIVIYHGKANWNINATLGEMIKGYKDLPEDIQKYIPDYEYLLYDISMFTDEEIKGKVISKIAMTTHRDIFTKDTEGIIESVYKMAEYFSEIMDQQTGIEYFETLMRYIFSTRADVTKEAANEIIRKIESTYPEGSEIVMTLAEKFREEGKEEGIMKGMERGMEVGAKQGKLEVARNALIEGVDMDLIVRFTGLLKKEIEEIAKEMDI